MSVDLGPAARQLAALVGAVPADRLGAPTPCPDYTVGDLLDHISGLTAAFTGAARKDLGEPGAGARPGDAARLASDWQAAIPLALDALADAWRDPRAWTGMTRAGGIDLPGEIGGLVALDELVVHGWDLAMGTGRLYSVDAASLEACRTLLGQFGDDRGPAFAAPVDVPDDAPLLDRVIALSGRDPAWPAVSRR